MKRKMSSNNSTMRDSVDRSREDSQDSAPNTMRESPMNSPKAAVALSPRTGSLHAMIVNQNMMVIPTTEQESLAYVKATQDEAFRGFVADCEKRNLILPVRLYVLFFASYHCNRKKALKRILEYWKFYESIHFKNIVTVDVSAALLSHILSPQLHPEWVDKEGRPLVVMRANLWFEGDPTQPSTADLKLLLMWIAEQLARTVHVHYTGFTFIMDMQGWTKKNFSNSVYSEILRMVQYALPIRCERFLFVDVPKAFTASWKLISASLSQEFKKVMIVTTRADM